MSDVVDTRTSSGSEASATLPPPIDRPYLLLTFIPYYQDEAGGIWLEQLWHRDFVRHRKYLRDLTLAAPCLPKGDQPDLVRVEDDDESRLSVLPLPPLDSMGGMLKRLPKFVSQLWKGIGRCEIVHSGIAGWPLPVGWIANPIALLRRKKLLMVIESAPWRDSGGSRPNLFNRVRSALIERLGRFYVNRADLTFFTQPAYMESFMTRGRGEGHVVPASWINEDEVISDAANDAAWQSGAVEDPAEVRFVFPARLTEGKGVRVLLDALRILDRAGSRLRLDVIGEGDLRQECIDAKAEFSHLRYDVLEQVPYGKPFFDLIRSYHALLVPSLSDEQPRILFDAAAQGLPVVASNTDGIRPFVEHEQTGWLVPPNDPQALADTLTGAARDFTQLRACGTRAVTFARQQTHEHMHEVRWQITEALFGAGGDGPA